MSSCCSVLVYFQVFEICQICWFLGYTYRFVFVLIDLKWCGFFFLRKLTINGGVFFPSFIQCDLKWSLCPSVFFSLSSLSQLDLNDDSFPPLPQLSLLYPKLTLSGGVSVGVVQQQGVDSNRGVHELTEQRDPTELHACRQPLAVRHRHHQPPHELHWASAWRGNTVSVGFPVLKEHALCGHYNGQAACHMMRWHCEWVYLCCRICFVWSVWFSAASHMRRGHCERVCIAWSVWWTTACHLLRKHSDWAHLSVELSQQGETVSGFACLWSSPNKVRLWVGSPVCGALPTRWDCEWVCLSVELSQQGETVSRLTCQWNSPKKVRLWVGLPVCGAPHQGETVSGFTCLWSSSTKVRLWVGSPVQ